MRIPPVAFEKIRKDFYLVLKNQQNTCQLMTRQEGIDTERQERYGYDSYSASDYDSWTLYVDGDILDSDKIDEEKGTVSTQTVTATFAHYQIDENDVDIDREKSHIVFNNLRFRIMSVDYKPDPTPISGKYVVVNLLLMRYDGQFV